VQSCKPIARGFIVGSHPGYLNIILDNEGQTRRINITASRSLIEITEVLVPNAIHNLHRQTIQWIYSHGSQAVVATSQLRSRSETPPLRATALTFGFSMPAPASSTLTEDHSEFSISYPEPEHTENTQFNIWEPSEDDLFMDTDSDCDSDIEVYFSL
jgi:hypothetical protein